MWLARLAANRSFLGQLALSDLSQACQRDGGQGYSPQVMMLGKARAQGRYGAAALKVVFAPQAVLLFITCLPAQLGIS